jgi:hypothetical protein
MLEQMLMSGCFVQIVGAAVGCETTNEMGMMGTIVGASSGALLGLVLFRRMKRQKVATQQ